MVTLSELVVFHGVLPFQVKNQEAFRGKSMTWNLCFGPIFVIAFEGFSLWLYVMLGQENVTDIICNVSLMFCFNVMDIILARKEIVNLIACKCNVDY